MAVVDMECSSPLRLPKSKIKTYFNYFILIFIFSNKMILILRHLKIKIQTKKKKIFINNHWFTSEFTTILQDIEDITISAIIIHIAAFFDW